MKRLWPWIVGGVAIFFVGLVALAFVAFSFLNAFSLDDGVDPKGPAAAMEKRVRQVPGVAEVSHTIAYDWLDGDEVALRVSLTHDPSAEQLAGLAEAMADQAKAEPLARGDRWDVYLNWHQQDSRRSYSPRSLPERDMLLRLHALDPGLGQVSATDDRVALSQPGDLASYAQRVNEATKGNDWRGTNVVVSQRPAGLSASDATQDLLGWRAGAMPDWFPDTYRDLRRAPASINLKLVVEEEKSLGRGPERPVISVLFGDRSLPADNHDALPNDPSYEPAREVLDRAYALPHAVAVEPQRRAERRDGTITITLARVDNENCRLWRQEGWKQQQLWTDYLLRDGRRTRSGQALEQCR